MDPPAPAPPATLAVQQEIHPSHQSLRFAALREFRKIYYSNEDRFGGGLDESCFLDLPTFNIAGRDYEVPVGDYGNLLTIRLEGNTTHFFMEFCCTDQAKSNWDRT